MCVCHWTCSVALHLVAHEVERGILNITTAIMALRLYGLRWGCSTTLDRVYHIALSRNAGKLPRWVFFLCHRKWRKIAAVTTAFQMMIQLYLLSPRWHVSWGAYISFQLYFKVIRLLFLYSLVTSTVKPGSGPICHTGALVHLTFHLSAPAHHLGAH